MEIKLINYQLDNKRIDLTIKNNTLIGITGANKYKIVEAISLNNKNFNNIIINDIKVTKDNYKVFKKRIKFIPSSLKINHFLPKVSDVLIDEIKRETINLKDSNKKIIDSLKIVGLSIDYLSRDIQTLSTLEKKLIQISLALLSNPTVLIIEEPFKNIDLKKEKQIMLLFQKIIEQYQKTIIFVSNDANILYKYTKEMIFVKNNEVIESGKTYETYQRVSFLKKNKIEIPDIVEFTYLAKKEKNAKIIYHNDIRDIIKDIYKHV